MVLATDRLHCPEFTELILGEGDNVNSDYHGKYPSVSGLRCDSRQRGGGFSPPLMGLEIIWEHSLEKTGHSWTRLNSALRQYIDVCISVGMPFDLGDFAWIGSHYNSVHWADSERWYSIAVDVNNLSACKSLETHKKREPFVFNGRRLAVGTDVHGIYDKSNMGESWKTLEWAWLGGVKVTSFAGDNSKVNLTITQAVARESGHGYENKVVRRFSLTHSDLKAANALIRDDRNKSKQAEKQEEAA